MKLIDEDMAQFLYEQLELIGRSRHLTPKENIPKVRTLLETLFKELTRHVEEAFTNLYARMLFIQNTYYPPRELVEPLHDVRIFANKVVHEAEFIPDEADFATCLRILSEGVAYFSSTPMPATLTGLWGRHPDAVLSYKRKDLQERLNLMDVTVLGCTEIRTAVNGFQYCIVVAQSPDFGKITINFRDFDAEYFGSRLSEIGNQVWKYARLYVFNVKLDAEKEDMFLSTPSTFYVLEPDYLVAATDIAVAFEAPGINPYVGLLNTFMPDVASTHLLIGGLVNALLDELLYHPEGKWEDVFDRTMRDYALDIMALIHQKDLTLAEFTREVREVVAEHVTNIRRFIETARPGRVYIEPSFYAPMYGLYGRLDLMFQQEDLPQSCDIVELKSGKAPSLTFGRPVKPEHEAQTNCYSMMLEATFRGRSGNNSILYSRAPAGQSALRSVHCTVRDRQNIMMARNVVVSNDFALARNQFGPMHTLLDADPSAFAWFHEDRRMFLRTVFELATPTELDYVKYYAGFLKREQRVAKIGSDHDESQVGFSALWRCSLGEKLDGYAILYYLELDVETSDFVQGHLRLLKRNLMSKRIANFRAGDIALLYPQEASGEMYPLRHQALKCYIKEMTEEYVLISFRNKQLNPDTFARYEFWALEHDVMEKSFNTQFRSLFNFLNAPDARRKRVLLGLEPPVFDEQHFVDYPELSSEQNELLNRALSARDYFMVQGPPGTGKTSTILKNLVRHLFDQTNETLLILSFTNRSVDEICHKLEELKTILPHLTYFRLGYGDDAKQSTWRVLTRNYSLEDMIAYLSQVRIVVSTVSSFLSNQSKLRFKRFDTAIVDEASQLLEPHLAGVLVDVGRFVLIGDEKQLPAVVAQKQTLAEVRSERLNNIGVRYLSISLFERLLYVCNKKQWSHAHGMLTQHGRMHRDVASFVNQHYYGNRLRAIYPRQTAPFAFYENASSQLEAALASGRLVFFNTPKGPLPKVNGQEAAFVDRIARLVEARKGDAFAAETLGVITPYRAQIAEISNQLHPRLRGLVTVDTVERFQGSERDFIVLSLAVNNQFQLRNLQNLTLDGKVDRKLNVALTRAREQVIILGCVDVLIQNRHYRQLIEYAREAGTYFQLSDFAQVAVR